MSSNIRLVRVAPLLPLFLIGPGCGSEAPAPPPVTGGSSGSGVTSGGSAGTTGGTAGDSSAGTAPTTGGTSGTGTGGATSGAGGTVAGGGLGGVSTGGTSGTTGGAGLSGMGGTTLAGAGGAGAGGAGAAGTGAGGAGAGGAGAGGAGAGGAGAGGAGTGGAGDGGTGGMPEDLMAVATPLQGKMLLGPCLQDSSAAVCQTSAGACPGPGPNGDHVLDGVLTTDETVTLGGNMGQMYTITLHVQGEVESKNYNGGTDAGSMGPVSALLDGWRKGGTPGTNNAYNVYALRVTPPGGQKTDYFLNSIDPPGVENHTTYKIDYTATMQVTGGSSVRMIAADSNCSMIKNCGPMENNGSVCSMPLVLDNIESTAVSMNSSFDFTKPYNGQWIVLTVKSVTTP